MPTADAGRESPDILQVAGPFLDVQISGMTQDARDILAVSALIDTGATESCIDSSVAAQLGLVQVDTETVSGVAGLAQLPVYVARIDIPALRITIPGRFCGVHLLSGGQPYGALLGRSFLRNQDMLYEGRTGRVTISNDVAPSP